MQTKLYEDYYEDLQISPNADQETVERIYRLLAKKYHPDNPSTGDPGKFDAVTRAYRVISNPENRAAYDAGYDQIKTQRINALAKTANGNGSSEDQRIRNTILSVLYIDRRNNPAGSSVGVWQLEKLLGWPEKTLDFHVWYLKQKDLIERTDSGGYAITVSGIDVVEENELVLGKDRLLTEKGDKSESSQKSSQREINLKVVKKER
jgi:curved DNA-binding protein CbpA